MKVSEIWHFMIRFFFQIKILLIFLNLFSKQFFAAFVALFAACQASAIYPYASIAHHASVHPVAHHIPAITQYSSYPAHYAAPVSYAHVAHHAIAHAPAAVHVAAPLAYAHHGYAHHAYAHHAAPIIVAKHEAQYTAANRGSVHTAPLPGHAVSQTSLNLAPAPGTL